MGEIQERIARVEAAKKRVETHPMCLRLEEGSGRYTVIYPPGDWRVDGVTCSHGMLHTKVEALTRLYEAMEDEWLSSFPGRNR